MDLRTALEEYLKALEYERGCAKWTLRSYQNRITRFIRWSEKEGIASIEEVTHRHLRAYIHHERGKEQSTRSVTVYLAGLRSWFKWLAGENHLPYSPAEKIPSPKCSRKLPPVLSLKEAQALISGAPSELEKAIAALLLFTGIRSGELAKLRLGDVDLEHQALKVNGKGDKDRVIPFAAALGEVLRAYLKKRPQVEDQHFFITTHRNPISQDRVEIIIKRLGERILDRRIWPHLLRHTCATMLYGEATLREVQTLLGHSSPTTTAYYAQVKVGAIQKMMEHHPLAGKNPGLIPG